MDVKKPAPGWGLLPSDELTPDFVEFVNGLDEIEEARLATADGLRHFLIKGFSISEYFIKYYYEYVVKGEFEAREDDVFVLSFPKTGTTWLQEIVYLICNDFNYEKARSIKAIERVPCMEFRYTPKSLVQDAVSPRLIKSHLPFVLLPPSIMEKKCKMIYIARNPKDALVSHYHFFKILTACDYNGSYEDFVDYFVKGYPIFAPYDAHALQYWEKRDEPNILFLKYEELKKDLPKEIRKIASFLGKPFNEEQVEKLTKHCSFPEMQGADLNLGINYQELGAFNDKGAFFRKGIVGDWKVHGNEETRKIVDNYYNDKFKSKGLTFEFEI